MVSVGGYASFWGLESLSLTLFDFSGFSPRSAAATISLNQSAMAATSQRTTILGSPLREEATGRRVENQSHP
jgi:hypothetical protein